MSWSDVERNVALWTKNNEAFTDPSAVQAWARDEVTWGKWRGDESELRILGDVAGKDVVELGCGTAYFSARLAKRGARVVGVDPTPAQLDTARRMMRETGIEFELVQAAGESVPLPDASFDIAISEHGASTWADPYSWIPEAARLLRPGGLLAFLHGTPMAHICYPPVGEITTQLQRPYFGMGRTQWEEDDGVEYQLTHGDWIAVLRDSGFMVERLIELQARPDAQTPVFYSDTPADWARQWPDEEIWVARKT
ncbi:MAG: class I SAM-dependent methyltransferase [Acidobacteriota bacterium]|nr:class I SAM-dependent methyltransferase [Acidobacteriota bacterium]MDE3190894.1 class I SAM-dependent methyltransferase [Acidobacteriota bacterium]